jgi:hypothetical protein
MITDSIILFFLAISSLGLVINAISDLKTRKVYTIINQISLTGTFLILGVMILSKSWSQDFVDMAIMKSATIITSLLVVAMIYTMLKNYMADGDLEALFWIIPAFSIIGNLLTDVAFIFLLFVGYSCILIFDTVKKKKTSAGYPVITIAYIITVISLLL